MTFEFHQKISGTGFHQGNIVYQQKTIHDEVRDACGEIADILELVPFQHQVPTYIVAKLYSGYRQLCELFGSWPKILDIDFFNSYYSFNTFFELTLTLQQLVQRVLEIPVDNYTEVGLDRVTIFCIEIALAHNSLQDGGITELLSAAGPCRLPSQLQRDLNESVPIFDESDEGD